MKQDKPLTPRQKLDRFYGDGSLRYALESKLDTDTLQLLLDIVARYCQPRHRSPRRKISFV